MTWTQMTWAMSLAAAMLLPAPASAAAPRCDRCRDLPLLEKELFEQEFLMKEFQKLTSSVPYDSIEKMQEGVQKKLDEYLGSPAGGGTGTSSGTAHGEMGTDLNDCTLTEYVKVTTKLPGGKSKTEWKQKKGKEKDIEDRYRNSVCKEIADFVLAHEKTHQAQCTAAGGKVDFNDMMIFAQADMEAYAAGIQSLRDSISKIASDCGWHGSTHSTRKVGKQDMPVVPTPDEAKDLKNNVRAKSTALKSGRGR